MPCTVVVDNDGTAVSIVRDDLDDDEEEEKGEKEEEEEEDEKD
jgi:nitrogen fixation-related uncharacterized protein